MNIAIVLSGGVGKRFGSNLPKQYLDLNGRPVINYAMDSVLKSKLIDEIVLVIDDHYLNYVEDLSNSKIHVVPNGKERVFSIKNALDFIKTNYPECQNIIITQAVLPMVTSELIDAYLEKLNKYDVVTTAQKCPGELFNIGEYKKINRNEYYFCQSPEAFKFNDLYNYIDEDSEYTELIYHYHKEPKIYYYLDFHDNVKITTQDDLNYCEFLIKKRNSK